MAKEIERKFVVTSEGWRPEGSGSRIVQGYLINDSHVEVRVRIKAQNAYLTIKSKGLGRVRSEYEYQIPSGDAEAILRNLCSSSVIEKTRTNVEFEGRTWEVDEFEGRNAGLVLAEVELQDASEDIRPPPWVGQEVTEDPRYRNAYLAENPFDTWQNR